MFDCIKVGLAYQIHHECSICFLWWKLLATLFSVGVILAGAITSLYMMIICCNYELYSRCCTCAGVGMDFADLLVCWFSYLVIWSVLVRLRAWLLPLISGR